MHGGHDHSHEPKPPKRAKEKEPTCAEIKEALRAWIVAQVALTTAPPESRAPFSPAYMDKWHHIANAQQVLLDLGRRLL